MKYDSLDEGQLIIARVYLMFKSILFDKLHSYLIETLVMYVAILDSRLPKILDFVKFLRSKFIKNP